MIKPKLKIAPFIAEHPDDNGQTCFRIKIVNHDLFFKIYDVKIKLLKCSIVNNTRDVKVEYFEIVHDTAPVIHSYLKGNRMEQKLHACKFRTYDDVKTFLVQGQSYVQVVVKAKHSLSGISEVFTVKLGKTYLKQGDFEIGNGLNVIAQNG